MNEKDFVNLCKKAVAEYSNEHLDKSDGKKITDMNMNFIEKIALKEMLKRLDKTEIGNLRREYGVI